MYAALGILAAINARHASGQGQLVDVSLLESATSMLMTAIPQQKLFGTTMTRVGSRDRFVAPSNTYATGDGRYVLMVGGDDNMFPRVVRAMKRPALLDDPRFVSMASRLEHRDAVESIVADWMLAHDADEIVARLEAEGVPCAKIATIDEVVDNPQLRHRGAIADIPFGDSTVPVQGVTIHLSATPLTIERAMPDVGQQWLGLQSDQIAALQAEGAI
jgi:crotonobetainyl-CoA:carnitine CoA-transferase CaiB-like acyl-CoA transferase